MPRGHSRAGRTDPAGRRGGILAVPMPGWTEWLPHQAPLPATSGKLKGDLPALINLEWPADKSRLKMHPLELGVHIPGTYLSRAFRLPPGAPAHGKGRFSWLPQVAHLEVEGLGPAASSIPFLFIRKSLLKPLEEAAGEGGVQQLLLLWVSLHSRENAAPTPSDSWMVSAFPGL